MMDLEENKQANVGTCTRIFRGAIGGVMLLSMAQYALYGPQGFKMPKYQNMQGASVKK